MSKHDKKIPQPPIDPQRRSAEARTVWRGAAVAAVGIAILIAGLLKTHPVASEGADRSPEYRLVQALTAEALVEGPPGAGPQIDAKKTDQACPT